MYAHHDELGTLLSEQTSDRQSDTSELFDKLSKATQLCLEAYALADNLTSDSVFGRSNGLRSIEGMCKHLFTDLQRLYLFGIPLNGDWGPENLLIDLSRMFYRETQVNLIAITVIGTRWSVPWCAQQSPVICLPDGGMVIQALLVEEPEGEYE
jgi:hypothetical protein